MSVKTAVAFAAALLEHNHLVTLNERNENLALYFGTFHGRCSDLHVAVDIEKKYSVEAYSLSFLHIRAEMVDLQELAFLGLELLSLDFYDSVHLFIN